MKDLNGTPVLIDAVVDVERRIQELPDLRMPPDFRADIWGGWQ